MEVTETLKLWTRIVYSKREIARRVNCRCSGRTDRPRNRDSKPSSTAIRWCLMRYSWARMHTRWSNPELSTCRLLIQQQKLNVGATLLVARSFCSDYEAVRVGLDTTAAQIIKQVRRESVLIRSCVRTSVPTKINNSYAQMIVGDTSEYGLVLCAPTVDAAVPLDEFVLDFRDDLLNHHKRFRRKVCLSFVPCSITLYTFLSTIVHKTTCF